ncbi:transposable element Tc1 transposase [Trichonephila clavipes]|uniref:Transposable element Tc1 transposase n=1 Tax=Trichonephila clavipes TaxID=2585209 RepID=A0A8X6SGE3_TRICX|nr:transposable element Tc1 transposase [Trichonephila clavipes]
MVPRLRRAKGSDHITSESPMSEGRFDLSTFRSERTNEASTLTITPKRSSSRDVVFNDEFLFQLCPDDHQIRVWRRLGKRAHPALTIVPHTGPKTRVMQDNARPHKARVDMNYLKACQTLPWLPRPPDLSPIEHVWDMMGRRLPLSRNVYDLARQLEHIWQEIL